MPSSGMPLTSFDTWSLTGLECTSSDRLVGQPTPRILHAQRPLHGFWGLNSGPHACEQVCTSWTISLALIGDFNQLRLLLSLETRIQWLDIRSTVTNESTVSRVENTVQCSVAMTKLSNHCTWREGSCGLTVSGVAASVWLPPLLFSSGGAEHNGGDQGLASQHPVSKRAGGEVKIPPSLRICSFTHCYGRMPDRSSLGEDSFLLTPNSRLASVMAGQARQSLPLRLLSVSSDKRWGSTQELLLLFILGPQPRKWCHPHLEWLT